MLIKILSNFTKLRTHFNYHRLLILLIIPTFCATSDAQNYSIKYYTNDDGVEFNEVVCFYQDSKGYLWIGGVNGIARFDGNQFRTYKKKEGYNGESINSIIEDSKSNLWIVCSKNIIILKDGKFLKYNLDPVVPKRSILNCIEIYNQDTFLLATSDGIFKVSFDNITINAQPYIKFQSKYAINLIKIKNQNYILNYHTTISIIKNGNLISPRWKINNKVDTNIIFSNLFKDQNGRFYSITDRLWRIDPDNETMTQISPKFRKETDVHYTACIWDNYFIYGLLNTYFMDSLGIRLNYNWSDKLNTKINGNFIYYPTKKALYIGTTNGFIKIIKLLTCPVNSAYENQKIPDSIEIIDKYDDMILGIKNDDIYAFNRNNLIDHFNMQDVNNSKFKSNNSILNEYNKLYISGKNKYALLNYYNGIDAYDSRTKKLNSEYWNGKYRISAIEIFTINKNISISSGIGPLIIRKDNQIIIYPPKGEPIYHAITSSIATNGGIYSFTNKGQILFTNNEAITTEICSNITLPSEPIRACCSNKEDHLALYFESFGLCIFNNKELIDPIIIPQINFAGNIKSIVYGDQNSIYAWTKDRLYYIKIKNETNSYILYELQDNIFDDNANVSNNSCFKINDSLISFNNKKISYLINTNEIDHLIKNNKASPYLNSITINNNKKIHISTKEIINLPHIELQPNERNIIFEYGLITTDSYINFKLQYKLEPYDQEWNNSTRLNTAEYRKLPQGVYTMKIRKIGEETESNQAKLEFTILPFWWEMWWFKSVLFCVAVILLYQCFIFYTKIKLSEQEKKYYQIIQKEKIASLELLISEERLKTLQSQINPHFIFNILQSIKSSIYYNDSKLSEQIIIDFSNLIRQSLHISEQGFISVTEEINYINSYIRLEQIRSSNQFKYEIINSIDSNQQITIPGMILQPIVENAIKHGVSQVKNGKIKIQFLQLKNNRVTCIVSDNGMGIKENDKLKSHRSFGLQNINRKLAHYSELFNTNFEALIIKSDQTGTIYSIDLPILDINNFIITT